MADDYRLFGEVVNSKTSTQLQTELRTKEKQLSTLKKDFYTNPRREQKRQEDIKRLESEIEELKKQLTTVPSSSGEQSQSDPIVADSTYKQLKQYAKSLKTGEEIDKFKRQLLNQLQAKNIPVELVGGEYTVPKEYRNDPHYRVLHEFTKDRLFGDSKWQSRENKTNKQNSKMLDKMSGNPLETQNAIESMTGKTAEGATALGQQVAKTVIAMCMAIDSNNLAVYNQQVALIKQLAQKVDTEIKTPKNADAWNVYYYALCSAVASATPGQVLTVEFIQNAKRAAKEVEPKVKLSMQRLE